MVIQHALTAYAGEHSRQLFKEKFLLWAHELLRLYGSPVASAMYSVSSAPKTTSTAAAATTTTSQEGGKAKQQLTAGAKVGYVGSARCSCVAILWLSRFNTLPPVPVGQGKGGARRSSSCRTPGRVGGHQGCQAEARGCW